MTASSKTTRRMSYEEALRYRAQRYQRRYGLSQLDAWFTAIGHYLRRSEPGSKPGKPIPGIINTFTHESDTATVRYWLFDLPDEAAVIEALREVTDVEGWSGGVSRNPYVTAFVTPVQVRRVGPTRFLACQVCGAV